MLVIFFRALILYIIVFVVIMLMGKKELSKVQPFELVIIILIADLAASPMSSRNLSILEGIIPILTLLICYLIFSYVIKTNQKVQDIVCGKVTLIIEDGKIIEEELLKQQYTIQDIMVQLRNKEVFKVQDVKFATIEPNGDLNVITHKMNINKIPVNIIEDGKVNQDNVKFTNIDLEAKLKENKLEIKDILLATIDEHGNFLYQLYRRQSL